jgi:nicotinamide-nucleotide amidase
MKNTDNTSRLTAAIIATGTEIATGASMDTNSAFLAKFLEGMGISVRRHLTVSDDLDDLASVLSDVGSSHDLIVMTGGLGPTEDDFTRLAAAKAFKVPLLYSRKQCEDVMERMLKHTGTPTPNNHRQAWIPAGAFPVKNPHGSAPCFAFRDKNSLFVFLPGVPREARALAQTVLTPLVSEHFPGVSRVTETHVLVAASLGESKVDSLLSDLIGGLANPSIGLSAAANQTKIRVRVSGADSEETKRLVTPVLEEIERRLGDHCVGREEEGLFKTLAVTLERLSLKVFAEDRLTGGMFARKLIRHLPRECLAGALCLPEGSLAEARVDLPGIEKTSDLYVRLASPPETTRAATEGSPSPPGPEELRVNTRITLNRIPRGKPAADESPREADVLEDSSVVKGPPELILERASAHVAFLLFSFLRKKERETS